MKSVALYGGSFDPPHIGHEAVILELKKLDFIDTIVVMPTFLNPFKENFSAPAELRLQWLRELFNEDQKVEISDFEVTQNRKVPTIESVTMLRKRYEKVYLVIGADNLKKLKEWHQFEKLQDMVTFILVTRDGISVPKNFFTIELDIAISSSQLRDHIELSKLPKKIAKKIAHYYKEHNAKKN
jgi:nicotinate-nucleotide adenylyltransferase